MAFFEFTPQQNYRPKVAIVTQPARKVPTIAELGFRVIENIKTSVIIQGLLAKNKVTVRDTGCGDFVNTGVLARFITNTLSVDNLFDLSLQKCASAARRSKVCRLLLHQKLQ